MANPQWENGYVKIANEIMDALARIRIPGEAQQVLMVIIRKTYGFNKKEDYIPLSQFVAATGLPKPSVVRAVNKLVNMKIISISKKANEGITNYMINKDFDCWEPLAKKLRGVTKKLTRGSKKANKPLAKKLHSKDIKDNYQKTYMGEGRFVELYHQYCPFGSRVLSVTKIRKSHIKNRLKEHPDEQFWIDLFKRIGRSPFLRGEVPPQGNYKQFKLTIDFVTNENRVVDILEGKYDRTTANKPKSFVDRLYDQESS